MISVIVPSRGRPDELFDSLNSLGVYENDIEILVRLDEDDQKLDRYKELFGSNSKIRLYIKKRIGYLQFHKMMNFLALRASFDWIFEWNDDVTMTNPDWFSIFKEFVKQFDPNSEPVVINIWGQGETMYNLFPIVSRKYVDILGHFSLSPTCDGWIRIVSNGAKIAYNLNGIKPEHRKYGGKNPLKDKTYHEVEKDRRKLKRVWNEKRKILPQKLLDADIKKIIEYKNGQKIK